MENFINQFKIIQSFAKKNSALLKRKDIRYCDKCAMFKQFDNINCCYVCLCCGIVSGQYIMKLDNEYFPPYQQYNWSYTYTYSRYNQFEKYLDRSRYISFGLKLRLCQMFHDMYPVFQQLPLNKNRHNFIRYHYVIIKFLQLLRYNHLVQHFTLPKTKRTTYLYDMIWKQICARLHWRFIMTVCVLCIIEERKMKKIL